jgi:hypothetical protein
MAPNWAGLLLGAVVFVSLGSIVVVGLLLVKLPPTYFCDSHPRDLWIDRHPAIRWTALALKNLTGGLVLAIGIVMAMPGVPGPGLLVILIAITLLDFPGKRRLERRLIGRRRILELVNDLRQRCGKPPLILGEPSGTPTGA